MTKTPPFPSLDEMEAWHRDLPVDAMPNIEKSHLFFISAFIMRMIKQIFEMHDVASEINISDDSLLMAQSQAFYLLWQSSEKLGDERWVGFAKDLMPPHGDELQDLVEKIIADLDSHFHRSQDGNAV